MACLTCTHVPGGISGHEYCIYIGPWQLGTRDISRFGYVSASRKMHSDEPCPTQPPSLTGARVRLCVVYAAAHGRRPGSERVTAHAPLSVSLIRQRYSDVSHSTLIPVVCFHLCFESMHVSVMVGGAALCPGRRRERKGRIREMRQRGSNDWGIQVHEGTRKARRSGGGSLQEAGELWRGFGVGRGRFVGVGEESA